MTELPLRKFFGESVSPDRFLALAICSYGEADFAVFDQKEMSVRVINAAGAMIRRFRITAEDVRRSKNGRMGGLGHAKQTGPAIASDVAGNFYIYVATEQFVRIFNGQGEPTGGFEVGFPAEDILIEPDSSLLIPGYYKNFRMHRFSLKGKLLRSWMRKAPNSLLSSFDPSPRPLVRTAGGRYFFRVSEQHGIIEALDARLKKQKRLVRELPSYRRRSLVQTALAMPEYTSISITHPGEHGRIHSLLPWGKEGVALLVSNVFEERRFLECYDRSLALTEVLVAPSTPNRILHAGIQLGSGELIFLTSDCNGVRVSRTELQKVKAPDYLRRARSVPAARSNTLNAPNGPHLKDFALKKIQAKWSLVTKGLGILMDASVNENGGIEAMGNVRFLPWKKTTSAETARLQERFRRFLSSLTFNPRTESGIPRSSKVQLSLSLNNQIVDIR